MRTPDEMPGLIKRKLAYTETEILGGQLHQAVMYEPILTTVAGLLALIFVAPLLPPKSDLILGIMLLVFLALFLRMVGKWAEWTFSLYFFSSYRIIYIHGIATRKIAMLPLGKVTDMGYDRDPWGQLLGYGTFIIESAGQEQALRTLNFVPDSDNSYRQIVDWLFGKGTTNVNIIDVNMKDPTKAVPVWVRNMRARGGEGGSRPWWND
ncbi:MAG TPA: PH domain-containing protein [Kineosporiaceae bacterium]